ncbi:MAG: GyrI-like domain-containing protein [Armatimonadota bacterium]
MYKAYFAQVYRAIGYIEEHLTDEVNVLEIAEYAGYSAFHFGRIFQGLTGESVMEYVRKRRLTMAACALVQTKRRILDIAVEYQYDSQEAFTRSFKRAYGMTPGVYRRRGVLMLLCVPLTLPLLMAPVRKGEHMEPKIVDKEAMLVVGLKYTGKNEHREIPALWDDFLPRCREVQHIAEPNVCLGVCGDMQADGAFSYLAGVPVTVEADISEGMVAWHVPAAKYAVFTHRGPLDGENSLASTNAYIYREWLPASGYQRADTPDLELYDHRFAFGQEQSEMDIYIPIK